MNSNIEQKLKAKQLIPFTIEKHQEIKNREGVKSPRNWPKHLKTWLSLQTKPNPNEHKEWDIIWQQERSKFVKLFIATNTNPDSKPRILLGQWWFPHPHHFKESEIPMGKWRLTKQIIIHPQEVWSVYRGIQELERVWSQGLWKVKEHIPCFVLTRGGARGSVSHKQIRFLVAENFFIIRYYRYKKNIGYVGGRGWAWLPQDTLEVVEMLKQALESLTIDYRNWLNKMEIVFKDGSNF